jgi:bifunctional DNA-binding transcriptional regulator/antitoxin component of YhaV-PrlF toxin-antitoxin module
MTIIVNNQNQLVVPPSVQRRAKIKAGDRVELRISGGVITILPKLPRADDEYTQAQRRIVDAQVAEGLSDIREGRVSRRFETVDEMLISMKAGRKPSRRKTRPR